MILTLDIPSKPILPARRSGSAIGPPPDPLGLAPRYCCSSAAAIRQPRTTDVSASFARRTPAIYRIVEESQFVDPAIYRRHYADFARSYRKALTQAARKGEISQGNLEVRAWALMGIAVFLGQRYGVQDTKTPLGPVVDAAIDLIAHGMTG